MADCSYFRCVQERRFVKRELQKWYKNMVYIVGLERVAEELMGRRKWKQYQESLTQSHATDLLAKQSPSIEEQQETSNKQQQQNCENNKTGIKTEILDIKEENKLMTTEDVSEKLESSNNKDNKIDKEEDEEEEEKEQKIERVRPEPVDWKQQDKCYFCVDGKLLKVNESGELVVETSAAVQPEAELNKHIIESEDSSDDSDTIGNKHNNHTQSPSIQKNLEALLKTIGLNSNNMTSLESMAAQLAAFQRLQTPELNQMNPFYPNLFYQFPQISPTTTPDRTSSPSVKSEMPSPSPTSHTMGEQPLDLSAKPSGSIDSKNVFKAKPRISTVPGRRSYTEEELNNALQDILSGKLGTRRAAVLYGIPRSTLRNKVYKLAIEQKRELLADNPPIAVLEEEDDKDSGPDDDKDMIKLGSSNDQLQNYLKLLAESSKNLKQEHHQQQQKEVNNPLGLPSGSSWPIDPQTWIQSLIIANGLQGLGAFPSLMQQSTSSNSSSKEELPEFLRKLLTQPQQDMKHLQDDKDNRHHSANNGIIPNSIDPLMMMNLLQKQNLLQKSRSSSTPEMDMNDGGSDDSNAILKIPSIVPKTIYGSGAPSSSASSTQSKNGDISHSTPSTSPQISALSLSPQLQGHQGSTSALINHLSIRSPSLLRQRSESESPPSTAKFNLNDVIRQSISKNFQANVFDDNKHSTPLSIDPMDSYHRKPVISVIKNLGGTDISRFGTNPNISQMQQQQLSPNNTGTGGKGTRPKRGKYRNYDRDSLVEAVKAVQRGEMSVHRAGSYYGVPHSTLEYKVKERHLMRPRKREPKPQPLDSTSSTSTSTASTIKRDLPAMDKNKSIANAKTPLKPAFTSPNGIKMPPFIDHASMATAQLQLQSQLLWPHPTAFPGLGGVLDFASRSSSQNNNSPFPTNAESFFAQQMLQKFQEEQQQQQQQQQQQFKSPVNGNQNASSKQRDLENLYDHVSTNGSSFLDGIIRSTLNDKKNNEMAHAGNTLFEHLLKKNPLSNNSGPSDNDDDYKSNSLKRPGSPMNYSQRHDIKRERSSPSPNHEHNDAEDYASKLRENLTAATTTNTTMIKEEPNNGSHNNSDDVNSS